MAAMVFHFDAGVLGAQPQHAQNPQHPYKGSSDHTDAAEQGSLLCYWHM